MADMSREELRLMNGKKYSGANNRGEPFNKNNYNLVIRWAKSEIS